jgi:putative MATE family efflux protein
MNNGEDLHKGSIPKLLLNFSMMTILSLAIDSLYTMVDALFVSWGVGADALAGVTAVMPFTMLQSAVATAFGSGAAVIIARMLGAGDKEKASQIARNAFFAFWTFSLSTTVLGLLFHNLLLDALGVADALRPFAKEYILVILIGNVFSSGFSAIIRAEGKLKYAALQMIIPVCSNILLDYLFVMVFHWGIAGSALATIFCQFLGFLIGMVHFYRLSSMRIRKKKISLAIIKNILTSGFPSLIPQIAIAVGMVSINHMLLNFGGAAAQMVYAFISRIFMFCVMPFVAIMQALSPLAGQNIGAKKPKRVISILRWSIIYSMIVAAVELVFCEIFPHQLLSLFTHEKEILRECEAALRLLSLSLPLLFLALLGGALFQASGHKLGAILLYTSDLLPILPLAMIFGRTWGMDGVWIAFPVTGVFATLFAIVMLRNYYRNIDLEIVL